MLVITLLCNGCHKKRMHFTKKKSRKKAEAARIHAWARHVARKGRQILKVRAARVAREGGDLGQGLCRPKMCQKRPTIGAKETYYVRTFECLLISGSGYDRRRPHILLPRAPTLCLFFCFFIQRP